MPQVHRKADVTGPKRVPAPSELIAAGRTIAEIQEELGADWLIYQELDDLIEACREGNENIPQFDTSCFSGEYVTGVKEGYLERLQVLRSDAAKRERRNNGRILLAS